VWHLQITGQHSQIIEPGSRAVKSVTVQVPSKAVHEPVRLSQARLHKALEYPRHSQAPWLLPAIVAEAGNQPLQQAHARYPDHHLPEKAIGRVHTLHLLPPHLLAGRNPGRVIHRNVSTAISSKIS